MTDEEFTEWVASGIDRLLAAGIAREALTEKLECEIAAGLVERVSSVERQADEIIQRATEANESRFSASVGRVARSRVGGHRDSVLRLTNGLRTLGSPSSLRGTRHADSR